MFGVDAAVGAGVVANVVGSVCVLLMVLLRLIGCGGFVCDANCMATIRPNTNESSIKPVAMIAVLGSLILALL